MHLAPQDGPAATPARDPVPAVDAAVSDAGSSSSAVSTGIQDNGVLHVPASDAGTAMMDPAHPGGCDDDADCDRAAPVCDVAAHSCVECITHDDCTRATAAECRQGRCQPCTTNDACAHVAGRAVCGRGAVAGICVGCVSDADCTSRATPQCDGRACVPCTSNAACSARAGATVCDVTSSASTQSDQDGSEDEGKGRGKKAAARSPGSGACVECTDADDSACGERECDAAHTRCKKKD